MSARADIESYPCLSDGDLSPVVALKVGGIAVALSPDQARKLAGNLTRGADEAEAGAQAAQDPRTAELIGATALGNA